MKSYTDLDQSRKLAEILPLESADMHYLSAIARLGKPYSETQIPCWSLVALLGVIPKPDLVQNSEGTWLLHSWVNDYPWSVGGYSNPVDVCVEMIIKLRGLNLL